MVCLRLASMFVDNPEIPWLIDNFIFRRRNSMKKAFLVLLSILLLTLSLTPLCAFANEGCNSGSVVFVVDDTKSMQTNDKKKLTVVSVQKYIDKLNEGENIGNGVGIVTFSKKVLKTKDITNVDSKENKDNVKSWVKKNVEQEGSFTNCIVGIKQAVTMLEKSDNSNRAIILVTDGEYDFDEKDGSVKTQLSSANSSLQKQLDKAKEQGIKIYTIKIDGKGVANDGKVDFEKITKETDGIKFTAKNANEIDTAVEEIQRNFLSLSGDNGEVSLKKDQVTQKSFDIPEGVVYAVIQIDYEDYIEVRDFVYENGERVDYTEAEGDNYLNVRMSSPKSGKAIISIYSTADQTSKISYVYAGDMFVSAQLESNNVNTKESFVVNANVYNEGQLYDNTDNSISVEAVVKDAAGNEYDVIPLVQDDSTKEFTNVGDVIEDAGTYTVTVIVSGTDLASEDITLTVEKAPLSPITWVLIVLGILLLIVIIVIVAIFVIKKGKGMPGSATVPFGRFQLTQYYNLTTGENDAGTIWSLDNHPRINKKTKTLTVFDLINKQDLPELQNVVFSAVMGPNKAPVLKITNNSIECQVSVDGIPVSSAQSDINRGSTLNIEIMDKQVTIQAVRI